MKISIDCIPEESIISDIQVLNEDWKRITKNIFSQNRFIRSVQIDGETYYGDFDTHVLNHFDSIREVEINTFSESELLEENLNDIREYIQRLLSTIDTLSSMFYADLDDQGWKKVAQFAEGVEWLYKGAVMCVDLIVKTKERSEMLAHLEAFVEKLIPQVQSMEQQIQDQEYVEIGDLLTYELKPILGELVQAMNGIG